MAKSVLYRKVFAKALASTGGGGGTVTGSGTANFLAKWSSSSALTNSIFRDDGTTAAIGTTPDSTATFHISSTLFTEDSVLKITKSGSAASDTAGIIINHSASGISVEGIIVNITGTSQFNTGYLVNVTGAGQNNIGIGINATNGTSSNTAIYSTGGGFWGVNIGSPAFLFNVKSIGSVSTTEYIRFQNSSNTTLFQSFEDGHTFFHCATASQNTLTVNATGVGGVAARLALNPNDNTSVLEVVKIARTTRTTAQNNYGGQLSFYLEDNANNEELSNYIRFIATNVSSTSENTDFSFGLRNSGGAASESIRMTGSGDLKLIKSSGGIFIKEGGASPSSGVATLVAGTVTVNTTKVTASSRIHISGQNTSGTPGELRISARVAGTSFTITSSNALDTRDIAWIIIEPS